MSVWEWIENNWGCGICGLVGFAASVWWAICYVKLKARNVLELPDALREVAADLSGTYEGPGLFGRRPTICGTHEGVPVVIDFPDNWREALLGPGWTLTLQVWLRLRFTVPVDLRGRVRRRSVIEDLAALGVPQQVWERDGFMDRLATVLPWDGCDLVVRRGVAEVKVPIVWDAAQLPPGLLMSLVENAHEAVDEVCRALSCGRVPSSTLQPAGMSGR